MKTMHEFEQAEKDFAAGWVMVDGERENIECYAEAPCPKCRVGLIYGADFPNGDGSGGCLNCGANWEWDNVEEALVPA